MPSVVLFGSQINLPHDNLGVLDVWLGSLHFEIQTISLSVSVLCKKKKKKKKNKNKSIYLFFFIVLLMVIFASILLLIEN